ncbi:MAG TPA: hypothetical protein VKV33_05865 [Streptosporangiaceae bacterium]|nr:hypothetical protein [Streptosporangiaceae bacterium]
MKTESAWSAASSRRNRLLIGLAWGLIQLVIMAALFLGGGVVAGYLALDVFSGRGANSIALIGFAVGVAAAVTVNHRARIWLQRLRLRGLRIRGVAVEAEVGFLGYEYTASSRGPGRARYVARVSWTDPATGVRWKGERWYRCWGRGSKGLEAAFAHGAKVPVYYPPGRPSRFLIDVPFAPTMADFFL